MVKSLPFSKFNLNLTNSAMSFTNVALVGATGALGSAFATTLLEAKLKVTLLVRPGYDKVRARRLTAAVVGDFVQFTNVRPYPLR